MAITTNCSVLDLDVDRIHSFTHTPTGKTDTYLKVKFTPADYARSEVELHSARLSNELFVIRRDPDLANGLLKPSGWFTISTTTSFEMSHEIWLTLTPHPHLSAEGTQYPIQLSTRSGQFEGTKPPYNSKEWLWKWINHDPSVDVRVNQLTKEVRQLTERVRALEEAASVKRSLWTKLMH